MTNILVKIGKGEDGNAVVALGVNIQMQGTFSNGIVEQIGHRKMSRKFIDGVCKALVKQIQPQLLAAIKQEQHYQDHPEDIPQPPEGEAPPLNHALLARETIEADEVAADPGPIVGAPDIVSAIEQAPTEEKPDATE